MRRQFLPGDLVVYCRQERSTRPVPNAKAVYASPHGEDYLYHVVEHGTVMAVRPDGKVVFSTRQGEQRMLDADDPALKRAGWWKRLVIRLLGPGITEAAALHPHEAAAGSPRAGLPA